MENQHFDDLTRSWGAAPNRRKTLMLLGGGGLTALLAHFDRGETLACRKAKKRCRCDGQCCSGHCQKGRCKGKAKPPANSCAGAEPGTACGDGCRCLPTVSGGIVCGDAGSAACSTDAECEPLTGTGSVCFLNKNGEGSCAAPCPHPSPSPWGSLIDPHR